MGDFRITIEAAGGHGCQREAKQGEVFIGCGRMYCPDCEAKRFAEEFARRFPTSKATLTHWPADMKERNYTDAAEVVDDLLPKDEEGKALYVTQVRRIKGAFNP